MPAIDGQSISGVPLFVRLADPLRRLAEHLKVANDRVLECSRSKDNIPAACGILGDSTNGLNDMLDKEQAKNLASVFRVAADLFI